MHDRVAAGRPAPHQYGHHHNRRRPAKLLQGNVAGMLRPSSLQSRQADQADWQAFLRLAIVIVLTGVAIAAVRTLAQ